MLGRRARARRGTPRGGPVWLAPRKWAWIDTGTDPSGAVERGGGERLGHHLSSEEPAALDAAEVGEADRDTVGSGLHADGQVHAFQTHVWSLARVAVIRQSSEIEVGRDLLRLVVARRDILGAKASGGDEVVDTAAVRVRVRRA